MASQVIDPILTTQEADRVLETLSRLRQARLDFAITGGIAIACHASRGEGAAPVRRPLHDLDIVVANIGSLAAGLGGDVAIRHVHADAPPGRMLVQAFDPSTALRIDVFGAYGDTLFRCTASSLRKTTFKMVSREDIVARLGALLLDLARGEAVAPKHARDFSALVLRVDASAIQTAWSEHRRRHHPPDFDEAVVLVRTLVKERPDLLVVPDSPFRTFPCPRCRDHPTLRLAVRPAT